MKILKNMWRFTDTDADISNSEVYKTMELAESGNMKEFKKAYKKLSKQSFGADYLQMGTYKLMGWQFDFRPFLKKFLIREKYDGFYRIYYALNKTNIFDNMYMSRSKIIDILEDTRWRV